MGSLNFMKDCIKSKFKGDAYLSGIGLIFASLLFMAFIIKIINNFLLEMVDILILLLFISFILLASFMIRQIKFIIIKESTIKFHSLFYPFGKTLDMNNYTGKITTTETGSDGS